MHRDREDLQDDEREDPEDVRPVDRHERVSARADLAKPRDDPGEADDSDDGRADRREREPSAGAIERRDRGLRVVPARDVPDDEPLQPERDASQRVALRALTREALVRARRLLAEEAVRRERRREPREPIEHEGTAAMERLDDDVLHGALTVHEVEQRDVLGLEAEVSARAVLTVRVLDDRVSAAVAAPQVRALDVGNEARHERRVVEAGAQRLPDAVHYFARTTANAGTGRLMPFRSSSPTGCVSMRSSIAALSRWLTRIWPASARAERREARIVTLPIAA
jgi:hypothetical protein